MPAYISMATPKNPTYDWFNSNNLGFIHDHLKSMTLDDFAFLEDQDIDELIQETEGLKDLSKVDKLRFKASVRRLRNSHKNVNNNNNNYNNNNKNSKNTKKFEIGDMKLDPQNLTQDKQHVKSQHIENDCYYKLKLVVIGVGRVGKTSIIHQFMYDRFNKDIKSTVGHDFFSTVIWLSNDKRAFLKIWDTAGQEIYDSLNEKWLKDADCIVIVYDISNKDSFNKIETKFKAMIERNCAKDNVYIMVVGNKQDLREKRNHDKNGKNSNDLNLIPITVAQEMVAKFQKEANETTRTPQNEYDTGRTQQRYQWGFSEVTAMSNHQIQRIFETCAEYAARLNDDFDGEPGNGAVQTDRRDSRKGRCETIDLAEKLPNPNGEPDPKQGKNCCLK